MSPSNLVRIVLPALVSAVSLLLSSHGASPAAPVEDEEKILPAEEIGKADSSRPHSSDRAHRENA